MQVLDGHKKRPGRNRGELGRTSKIRLTDAYDSRKHNPFVGSGESPKKCRPRVSYGVTPNVISQKVVLLKAGAVESTDAPGSSVSATIRRLNASLHCCRRLGLPVRRAVSTKPLVDTSVAVSAIAPGGDRRQASFTERCKFRSFRQAISVQTGRRFRLKPTGCFGPKRHPVAEGFRGRLWRTAAYRTDPILPWPDKASTLISVVHLLMRLWFAVNSVNNGDKYSKLLV